MQRIHNHIDAQPRGGLLRVSAALDCFVFFKCAAHVEWRKDHRPTVAYFDAFELRFDLPHSRRQRTIVGWWLRIADVDQMQVVSAMLGSKQNSIFFPRWSPGVPLVH